MKQSTLLTVTSLLSILLLSLHLTSDFIHNAGELRPARALHLSAHLSRVALRNTGARERRRDMSSCSSAR